MKYSDIPQGWINRNRKYYLIQNWERGKMYNLTMREYIDSIRCIMLRDYIIMSNYYGF